MKNKAYIVVNDQQEREVLEKLEQEGLKWKGLSQEPTQWLPTRDIGYINVTFPYILFGDDVVSWCSISELKDNYEIVFDGRKEEKMSDKYVVSQEFMNKLEEWKEAYITDTLDEKYHYASAGDLIHLPGMIKDWWIELNKPTETNNRLIAIIRWVNGENVFEVEKPKKWVVRSKETDGVNRNFYVNVSPDKTWFGTTVEKGLATQFDTKEEADKYVNSLTESVPYK